MTEAEKKLTKEAVILRSALFTAREVIASLYDGISWDMFMRHDTGMIKINAALEPPEESAK